jgi:hypothetical protein
MKINDLYYWQLELSDGTIFSQWSADGKKEHAWKDVERLDQVVRVSLIPKIATLPRHDCIIDINNGHKFIKRFGRGFLKMSEGFELRRYLNCIVTNRYRLWVFPDGRAIVTPPYQEIRL